MKLAMLKQLKKIGIAIFSITGLSISGKCLAVLPVVSVELKQVMRDFSTRTELSVGGDAQMTKELAKLAGKGDPVAAYLYAAQVMETDPTLSKRMLEYASSKGCTAASTILGAQLMESRVSNSKGWRLLQKSAYSGDPLAQVGLAGHYLEEDDLVQAYAWFNLAYREFSGHPLMKITFDSQRDKFESGLSVREKRRAEILFKQLAPKVRRMPEHICASSVMATITIPPQNKHQETNNSANQMSLDQSKWKLFGHPNLVSDPVKFKQIKSSFSNDRPVLVMLSASWHVGKYEIEHWMNADLQLHQLLSECNVIVGDMTANQELRGLYQGDMRSVPVYAVYKTAMDEQPRKILTTDFLSAQEFKEFVEDACVR